MQQGNGAAAGLPRRGWLRKGGHGCEEADAHQLYPGLASTDIREGHLQRPPGILRRADETAKEETEGRLVQTSGNVEGHQSAIGRFCTPYNFRPELAKARRSHYSTATVPQLVPQ